MTRLWIRLVFLGALWGCMASASRPTTEEQRVWIAAARHVSANESAGKNDVRPLPVFERTSFPKLESSIAQLVQSAKGGLCGLPASESESIVVKLQELSAVEQSVRKVFAGNPEFIVTAERPKEGDYLGLSRVLFSADKRSAYLNLDIGGVSGSIVALKLDNGEWTKLEECAQWTSY
jgi:hypothetical protein